MTGVEPVVTHSETQAPFQPLQLIQLLSHAPLLFLPYTIFFLEDHKSKKALAFSLTKFLNVKTPLVINSDTGFHSSWQKDSFSNSVIDS